MFGYGEPCVVKMIEGMKGALMCKMYEFKENRDMNNTIDMTNHDVTEKTNRIERHMRWKQYRAACLSKQTQVPKQLSNSQSYQDIIGKYVQGFETTTTTTTRSTETTNPNISSKRVSREQSIEMWQGVNLLLGFERHGISSFEDFEMCMFSVQRSEMYERLVVSILRIVLPDMILQTTRDLIERYPDCANDAATAYMLGHMHVLAEDPTLITSITWPVAANMYLRGRSSRLLRDDDNEHHDDEERMFLQTMMACREPDITTSSRLHREACVCFIYLFLYLSFITSQFHSFYNYSNKQTHTHRYMFSERKTERQE